MEGDRPAFDRARRALIIDDDAERDSTAENCLPARVIGEEFVGANMRLYVEAESQQESRLLTSHGARSGSADVPSRIDVARANLRRL